MVIGIIIQILMLYIISRNLVVTSTFSTWYFPVTGTVQFRYGILLFLITVLLGSGRTWFWSRLRPRGALILASYAFVLVAAETVGLVGGQGAKRSIIIFLDAGLVMATLCATYIYATNRFEREDAIRFMLKPYCYFSIYIAATGLAAGLLVFFKIVDPSDWWLPAGMMKHDPTANTGHAYTMPYYLGIILYGKGGGVVGAFSFKRICGLFYEPHICAFFVTPTLFLLPLVFKNGTPKWKIRSTYLLLVSFLFFVHSVANIVILTVIFVSVCIRKLLLDRAGTNKLFLVVLAAALVFVLWRGMNEPGTMQSKAMPAMKRVVMEHVGIEFADIVFGRDVRVPSRVSFGEGIPMSLLLALLFHRAIMVGFAIKLFFSRRQLWFMGGGALYLVGHSMKAYMIFLSGLYLYGIFMFAIILRFNRNLGTWESRIDNDAVRVRSTLT